MKKAIESLGRTAVSSKVMAYASALSIPPSLGIDIVCAACCDNPEQAPDKRSKKISTHDAAIAHWVEKFHAGYIGRPSRKHGSPPNTKPDPAISEIIGAALPRISPNDLQRIVYAHRLSMSAENLVGPFVEEYVFERLARYGWALAWGETVKAVDLCGRDGTLIQIKNRSNTENSSSNKIRSGTEIRKWYRVDAATGNYLWDELSELTGVKPGTLSEPDFRQYVRQALDANPGALGVDVGNPWK